MNWLFLRTLLSSRFARSPLASAGVFATVVAASTVPLVAPAAPNERCPVFEHASTGLPTESEWRSYPAFVDFNDDGHLDLAAHPRKGTGPGVWLGDGRGTWVPSKDGLALPHFSCGVGVDAADVNGDGHVDLGVADHCDGLFIFYGDGKGGWRLAPLVDPVERSGREDLAFGDVDGDGHLDLVAIATSQGGIQLYRGDGKGGWRREQRGLPEVGRGKSISLADLNGDGQLDIAAGYRNRGGENSPVWLSDAEGRYQPAGMGLPDDGRLRVVDAGADLNGDGFADLAASGIAYPGRPPLLVYLGDGAGNWVLSVEGLPEPVSFEAPAAFYGVELTDLNADAIPDLVAVDWANPGVRVWLGNGSGAWTECEETGLPRPAPEHAGEFGYGVTSGDVNGDGKPDLAFGFGLAPKGSLQVWVQR